MFLKFPLVCLHMVSWSGLSNMTKLEQKIRVVSHRVATCRITIPISGGAAVEARERLREKYFEQGKIFRVTENIITHLFYKIDALNEV